MTRPKKPGDAQRVIHSQPGVDTGIEGYMLLAAKHSLKLEERGLIDTAKRTNLRTTWATKLGLNKQATYATIYKEIDRLCKSLEES